MQGDPRGKEAVMTFRRFEGDDGYVMVAALVFVALFASLAASTLSSTAGVNAQARTALHQLRSAALIDAGMASAGYALFADAKGGRPPSSSSLALDGGLVRIDIEDEAGRVDLNAADQELLAALYRVVVGGRLQPEVFAQAVVSWRETMHERWPGGAGRPFREVGDLRRVAGIASADVERLLDHTTVFNPQGGVDPLSAPLSLIAALPGMVQADLERLAAARLMPNATAETVYAALSSPSRHLLSNQSGIFRVKIAARLESGHPREASAVLAASEEFSAGFGILAWYGEGTGR